MGRLRRSGRSDQSREAIGDAIETVGSLSGPETEFTPEQQIAELESRVRELEAELAETARTDYLTGLPNRAAFDEEFKSFASRYQRSRGADGFELLFGDISKFKEINKARGHDVGDGVLKGVAQILAKRRPSDRWFRWGGEEFTGLVPRGTGQAVSDVINQKLGGIMIEDRPLHLCFGHAESAELDDLMEENDWKLPTAQVTEQLFQRAQGRYRKDYGRYNGLD